MKLLPKKKIEYENVFVLKQDEYDQILDFARRHFTNGADILGIESIEINFRIRDATYTKNYTANVQRRLNNNKIRR